MLNLVPEFSKLQRELFEALGDVRISYDLDSEIENRIDGIYGFQMIVIQEPDSNSIKTQEDLDSWKEKVAKEMDRLLKFEFRVKIEALIPLLLKQIRKT